MGLIVKMHHSVREGDRQTQRVWEKSGERDMDRGKRGGEIERGKKKLMRSMFRQAGDRRGDE